MKSSFLSICYLRLALLIFAISLLSCEKRDDRLSTKASPQLLRAIAELKRQNLSKSNDFDDPRLFKLPFKNPPEVKSLNGVLNTDLDVRFTTSEVYNTVMDKNISLLHRSYNGRLVGPTLRLKPGDSMIVNLRNNLPVYQPSETCDPYLPIQDGIDPNYMDTLRFNNTNLHTHGLHVSPMAHGDNVFVNLNPGCHFQNRIEIPRNHAPGTFWYHAHLHGSTAIQVSSGMGGTILIEGGLDHQPDIRAMQEKLFVLQQIPYTPDTIGNPSSDRYAVKFIDGVTFGPTSWSTGISDSTGWRTTINGMTIPVIELQSTEAQRWRFVHAGVRETINLKLVREDGNQIIHEKLYAIAEDGIAYGYRDDVDSMILQPGYRADILVQTTHSGGNEADTLYLIDADSPVLDAVSSNDRESEKVLAIVVIPKPEKSPVADKLPTSQELAEYAPYPSLVNTPVTADTEYVNFVIRNVDDTTRFQINNVSFSHTNPPRLLNLNDVQQWTLTSSLGGHPFHIHINHFQIQKRFSNGIEQPIKPKWKDTYFVPQTDSVIVKTVYKDFIGDFVLHCHILDHEDQGMMQCVRIDSANRIGKYLIDQGIQFCGPGYENSISSNVLQ